MKITGTGITDPFQAIPALSAALCFSEYPNVPNKN